MTKPPQTSTERGREFVKNKIAKGMRKVNPTIWVHKSRVPEAREAIKEVMHSRDWTVPKGD